jgi:hypothetical protein
LFDPPPPHLTPCTLPSATGYTVSPTDPSGTPALVTARPIVKSASSNAGGVVGGYPLTVLGTGFSNVPSENVVLLDGVPCTVSVSSLNALTCVPGPKPGGSASGKVYRGGPGTCVTLCVRLHPLHPLRCSGVMGGWLRPRRVCRTVCVHVHPLRCSGVVDGWLRPCVRRVCRTVWAVAAGLLISRWRNVTTSPGSLTSFQSPRYPASPNDTLVSTQGGVSSNGGVNMAVATLGDGYIEQAQGLFVAPLTTTYRFYLLSEMSRCGAIQTPVWVWCSVNAAARARPTCPYASTRASYRRCVPVFHRAHATLPCVTSLWWPLPPPLLLSQ